MQTEWRAFQAAVGLMLLIPLLLGTVGAFGGLEATARLFGENTQLVVPPLLKSNLRALCCCFLSWVPLLIWSLSALVERAGAFRIIAACAFLAGWARLTGWAVEGYPGAIPIVIMAIELVAIPIVSVWHARLVGQLRASRGT